MNRAHAVSRICGHLADTLKTTSKVLALTQATLEAIAEAQERATVTYPVRTFLDLSTGHLSLATREWLDALDWKENGPAGGPMVHGWFIYAHDDNDCIPSAPHAPADEYPADLWACMERARKEGCSYLLFDADAGDPLHGLPYYGDSNEPEEEMEEETPDAPEPPFEPAVPLDTLVRAGLKSPVTLGDFLDDWSLKPTSTLIAGLARDGYAGGGDVERVHLALPTGYVMRASGDHHDIVTPDGRVIGTTSGGGEHQGYAASRLAWADAEPKPAKDVEEMIRNATAMVEWGVERESMAEELIDKAHRRGAIDDAEVARLRALFIAAE